MFFDPAFWRQQAYLLLRMTVGFAVAVGELSLIAAALGWITLPIWYRWTDNDYGSWHVDTLGRALLFVPAGIAALIAAGWLVRASGSMWAWLVRSLLAPQTAPPSPETARRYRRRALWIEGGAAAGLVVLMTIIWAFTGRGYFWPEWVLLPLALLLAVHAVVELVVAKVPREEPQTRALAIHGGVVAALFLFLTAVWARDLAWQLLAGLGAARAGVGARRALRGRARHEARPARAPGRDARDDALGRRRGAGRRAPPDRARPPRRRPGTARRARSEPGHGRAEVPLRARGGASSSSPRPAPASPRR